MKRWWLWLIVVILAAASSDLVIRQVKRKRRTAANAAAIHLALIHYEQNLKPGLSRKEVKDYLQAHGVEFGERCCNAPRDAFSILVRVGEEEVPWYCSSWPDYVSFEFIPTEAQGPLSQPLNSDALKEVHLTSNGEGCL
jgi:hypothetical protein